MKSKTLDPARDSERLRELIAGMPAVCDSDSRQLLIPGTLAADNAYSIDPQRIGQRLRAARKAVGMRQVDASGRTGIRRSIVARAEAGVHMHTLDTLCRLATAYGVTVASLLTVSANTDCDRT